MATIFMESFAWVQNFGQLFTSGKWTANNPSSGTGHGNTQVISTTDPPYAGGRFLRLNSQSGVGGVTSFNQVDFNFAPKTELFASLRIRRNGSASQGVGFEFRDAGGNSLIAVAINSVGDLQVREFFTGTIITTAPGEIPTNAWVSLQMRLVVDPVSGVFEIRKNGGATPIIAFSGNTRRFGSSLEASRMRFRTECTGIVLSQIDVADVFLNDTVGAAPTSWPGDVRVRGVAVAAKDSGPFTVTGAANAVAALALPNDADTSFISSETVGDEDVYSLAALPDAPAVIHAAQAFAVIRKTDSGSRTVSTNIKSGASEASQNHDSFGTTYTYLSTRAHVDPDTGLPWTTGAVSAAKVSVQIEA